MATEFKLKDYSQDTELSDKMIAKSSPINDYKFEDNLEFEATKEVDAMPIQSGSFRTSPGSTRVEISQPDNALFIFVNGVIRTAFSGNGINFNSPAEVASGAIYGLGTNALVVDVGTGGLGYVFDDGALYPDPGSSLDLGRSTARWDTIYLVNTPNVSSDRRLKDDIQPISYGIEAIMKMKPVKFKLAGKERLGFIADEMADVVPEITDNVGKENEMASMRYSEIIPVLVKAMHEQQAQIDELITEVGDLRSQLML